MPLAFTKNMGQWDERVLFRASAGGATMWFTKEGVTYQFTRRIDRGGAVSVPGLANAASPFDTADRFSQERDSVEQMILTAKFVGANSNPEVVAEGQLEYKCNYFIGNDPSKWHTDVPNYEAITLKDIYPGIDIRYSGDGTGQASYAYIVEPGADVAQVKIAFEGAEKTLVDSGGTLLVQTKWGDVIVAFAGPTNDKRSGSALFSREAEDTVTLETTDQSRMQSTSLNVGLIYSTLLGGSGYDEAFSIAVDNSGNAYVTGWTQSIDFPTQNPYQTYHGNQDVFVTKLSTTGNSLIYSTYLGGEDFEFAWGIAVDNGGNAYVTGGTGSMDFPTQNPFQSTLNHHYYDAFVTKLNADGNALVYSTYLGGRDYDESYGIAVDGNGNAFVTGLTYAGDFPTQNSYQSTFRGGLVDAFITKLNPTGSTLAYSTYLGGLGEDEGYGVAIDANDNAYVTGRTVSTDFPTQNPLQATLQGGPFDAFVTKLSSAGNSLIYSTYLGGGEADAGHAIAVDGTGNAYVTGETWSSNFPTQNPYQGTFAGGYCDAFVCKLSSSGSSLLYSTYLGGGDYDKGFGIAVDNVGNAYVAGATKSSLFPIQNPYQSMNHGDWDFFVTKLKPCGRSLEYSTYLGGSGMDGEGAYCPHIAIDNGGNAYVTGMTWSADFPLLNPYQSAGNGPYLACVTKFGAFSEPQLCGDADGSRSVDISDAVYLIAYIFGGGPEPCPYQSGDANCSGSVDISDAVYLIAYIFSGGLAPCAGCK